MSFDGTDDDGSGVLETLELLDSSGGLANQIIGGSQSDGFGSSTTAVGALLGLGSAPSGSVSIGGQAIAINLAEDSLTDIQTKINDAGIAGVNAVDYSGYPDCRPEFIDAYRKLAALATKVGVEGNPIDILAPLQHLTKAEIIRLGCSLGVDYGQTTSCYDPHADGRPCGSCDACLLRANGFAAVGVRDPAVTPRVED